MCTQPIRVAPYSPQVYCHSISVILISPAITMCLVTVSKGNAVLKYAWIVAWFGGQSCPQTDIIWNFAIMHERPKHSIIFICVWIISISDNKICDLWHICTHTYVSPIFSTFIFIYWVYVISDKKCNVMIMAIRLERKCQMCMNVWLTYDAWINSIMIWLYCRFTRTDNQQLG